MSAKPIKVDKSLLECPYCGHNDFVTMAGTKPYSPEERAIDFDRVEWVMQCMGCKKAWMEIFKIESMVLCSKED